MLDKRSVLCSSDGKPVAHRYQVTMRYQDLMLHAKSIAVKASIAKGPAFSWYNTSEFMAIVTMGRDINLG